MFNTLYSNIKASFSLSSVKFILSLVVFGISIGLGTNKLFAYLVDRYTQSQFMEVATYEKLTDKKIEEDERSASEKFNDIHQDVHGLNNTVNGMNYNIAQLLAKIDVLSNQLDAVSGQTYLSYKLSRKLIDQKNNPGPPKPHNYHNK